MTENKPYLPQMSVNHFTQDTEVTLNANLLRTLPFFLTQSNRIQLRTQKLLSHFNRAGALNKHECKFSPC